jgi:hypothetical protein
VRIRLVQAIALATLVAGAYLAYRGVVGPDPKTVLRFAEDRLASIFGPRVEYDAFRIDLVEGVEILGLKVYDPRTTGPTLEARRVALKHDVLALSSGVYVPEDIEIQGARILMHETESGLEADFPFTLTGDDEAHAPIPAIRIEDATILVRARPGSTRLAEGTVLVLRDVALAVTPRPDATLSIEGGLYTTNLGQDDVRIRLEGTGDARADTLDMVAVWDPLELTPALLATLAPDIAKPLRGSQSSRGRLEVTLTRHPGPQGPVLTAGEIRVAARWIGEVRMDLADLPGGDSFDEATLERLRELFGTGVVDLQVAEGSVEVKALTTQVGSATVRASGRIEQGGERLRFDFEVRGLRLDDPVIRRAIGKEASGVLDDFELRGTAQADIRLLKEPGRDLAWEVDAEVVDADVRVLGPPTPEGRRDGFPYPIHHVNGKLRVRPGAVWFDGFEGRNGARTFVRLLPNADRTSWAGEETGRIRFTEHGPDVRLSAEAVDVPVDADLRDAVAQSDFYEMWDRFRIGGVLDKIEVDLVRVAGKDVKLNSELRITLDGEEFAWSRFPMPLRDVRGVVTHRRPLVDAARGRVYDVDARARTWDGDPGADVTVRLTMDEVADAGRLHVTGKGVRLEGTLGETILQSELTRGGLADVWRFLAPEGLVDVDGEFPLGEDPSPIRIQGTLLGASLAVGAGGGAEPFRLTDLRGRVTAVDDHVTIVDEVVGLLEGAVVRVRGSVEGADGAWDLHVDTEPLPLTPRLVEGLGRLSEGGGFLPEDVKFESGGRVALSMHLRKAPGGSPRADVVATGLDLTVRIADGPPLGLSGGRLTVKDGEVTAEGIVVRLPGLEARTTTGRIGPKGVTGRFAVRLSEFALTEEFLSLFPEDLRPGVSEWLGDRLATSDDLVVDIAPDGGVRVTGTLSIVAREGAPTGEGPRGSLAFRDVAISPTGPKGERVLSGTLRFLGFTMDPGVLLEDLRGDAVFDGLRVGDDPAGNVRLVALSGKVEGVRFRDLSVPLVWRDGILAADPISGVLSAGSLRGRFVVHTREPEAFEGDVSVVGFDLAQLRDDLAPTGPPLCGTGTARVAFQSRGGGLEDLTAAGRVSIRDGNLGDLPAIANLPSLLSRILPGDTPPVFERADVEFTIRQEVVHLDKIVLAGDLFEMPGKGTIDFSGFVDVTFTPDFIKSMILPGAMQVPVLGDVLEGVLQEDLLYAIRISGDLSTAEPELVLLPPLQGARSREFVGTGSPPPPPRRIPRLFR